MKSTYRIFANTAEEQTLIAFDDISYLSVTIGGAVLQVINHPTVAIETQHK